MAAGWPVVHSPAMAARSMRGALRRGRRRSPSELSADLCRLTGGGLRWSGQSAQPSPDLLEKLDHGGRSRQQSSNAVLCRLCPWLLFLLLHALQLLNVLLQRLLELRVLLQDLLDLGLLLKDLLQLLQLIRDWGLLDLRV